MRHRISKHPDNRIRATGNVDQEPLRRSSGLPSATATENTTATEAATTTPPPSARPLTLPAVPVQARAFPNRSHLPE
jgi:hypothetical protein